MKKLIYNSLRMNYEMVLATNNKHKLQEVREILSPCGIIVYCPRDLNMNVPEPVEDGKTYYENALIKAKNLAKYTIFPVIADDSGLEVEAMDNKPGIYSARFASECGGHDKAIETILNNLKDKDNRRARFVCDIVLVNVEDKPLRFEGIVDGEIGEKPEGEGGFGYDPIFISKEANKCYGLLEAKEKNIYSHRAKALKKLITYLRINGLIKK